MNTFQVLILICAAGLSYPQCDELSATDVIEGPPAKNEIECALQSQAYLAQTELGRSIDLEKEYVKIRCRRTNIGKDNVG